MADEKLELRQASKDLKAATEQLQNFNQSTAAEIGKTVGKDLLKVTDPFVNSFKQIPGVETLGAVGKTMFNKVFAALKQKREENLLRERLGLTRQQFDQMKYQKEVIDAQKKYGEQLSQGADNLLGLDLNNFDIETGMVKYSENVTLSIDRLNRLNQLKLDNDAAYRKSEESAASKRVEADNEAQRERDRQANVFDRIAGGIDNLAEGIQNIKAEDVGMGLLAPLGLIGGILVAFVGGFVKSIKDQIAAIKLLTGDAFKGFKTIGTSLTNLIKALIPEGIKTFFSAEGKFGKSITNLTTRIKSAFTLDMTKLPKFNLGIGAKLTSMSTTLTTFFAENKFFKTIGEVATKFSDGLKSVGTKLGSFFNSIKGAVGGVASMSAEGGVIGKIMGFARGFGATLGKLFLPVTIIISAFDLITGFVDGFKESEGDNIVSKFIDGVGGGLGKMIGNLIGIPLDLLKDGVAWILGKLGFKDAKKVLNDFSFADLIMKIVKAPFNMVSKAIDYIVGVFTGENNPIEDLLSGVANVAEAAKGLLKGILRSILPSPKNEDGGVMGWIKSQVSKVIPSKVYEFAGLNPETGERLLPKASEESLRAISEAGLAGAYMKAQKEGNADEMEKLIRESEMRKNGGAETIVNNYNSSNVDQRSSSQTITSTNVTDPAAMVGSTTN